MSKKPKASPAPTVLCPRDAKRVPVWNCLGSLTQGRKTCPYLVKASIYAMKTAEVECKWLP